MASLEKPPITLTYKTLDDHPFLLDLYLPASDNKEQKALSAVIYFHGGGLTVGTRKSWFPTWLHDRCIASECAFISADYRLLPTSTGHDILDDVRDVFRYVRNEINAVFVERKINVSIDGNALAVAGTSAGGLCAYLAGSHVEPRPRAVLAMYAMGGDLITSRYLEPKLSSFFLGREMLDHTKFGNFLYPDIKRETVTASERSYYPADSPTPGYPANPRMLLARLYMQLGTFIDYYTGQHEPSLTHILRASEDKAIPENHILLFPQLLVDSKFPPTHFLHGECDTAVLVDETHSLHALLKRAGVETEIQIVEGQEHSFDYADGANEKFQFQFDKAWAFVQNALKRTDT